MRIASITCCLSLCFWLVTTAYAAPPADDNQHFCRQWHDKAGRTLAQRLDDLYRNGCLGGEKDSSEIAAWVNKQIVAEQRQRTAVARSVLVTLDERLSTDGGSGEQAFKEHLQKSILAISSAQYQVNEYLQAPHYRYNPMTGYIGTWLVVRQDILMSDCAAKKTIPAECEAPFTAAQRAVRYATLAKETISYLRKPEGLAYLDSLELVDQQWDLYATEARAQFWWELWANGRRFQSTLDEAQNNNVSKRLLTTPPSDQIILVHPTVALEYIDNAGSGSKFAPSLMVEWIGYNRWTWSTSQKKDEKTGQAVTKARIKNALGVSFVSSLSDRNGTGNLRHGAMLHYDNRYSLGATYGDGDLGVFINLDLMQLITSKTKKIDEVREKIRLKGF